MNTHCKFPKKAGLFPQSGFLYIHNLLKINVLQASNGECLLRSNTFRQMQTFMFQQNSSVLLSIQRKSVIAEFSVTIR